MRTVATLESLKASVTTPRHTLDKPQARPLTPVEGSEFKSLVASMIPCRNADPELWFAEQAPQMAAAKALCQQCPIAVSCLQDALEREEPWGVWGGEILVDGKVVAQKRGRGRPRKSEVA